MKKIAFRGDPGNIVIPSSTNWLPKINMQVAQFVFPGELCACINTLTSSGNVCKRLVWYSQCHVMLYIPKVELLKSVFWVLMLRIKHNKSNLYM